MNCSSLTTGIVRRFTPALTRMLVLMAAVAAAATGAAAEFNPSALRQQLDSPNRNTVLRTVHEVGEWGPLASDLAPDLITLLKRDDVLLRHDTSVALGKIGPAAAAAVGPLTDLLRNDSILLQRSAADALGEIGPAAMSAVPQLAALLDRWDELFLKTALARAIIRIAPPDDSNHTRAITALTDTLVAADDDAIRAEASMALAEAGEPAIEALTKLIGHSAPAVCWSACDALGEMGPLAAPAVPALVAAIDGEHALHHDVCWHSARALGLIHRLPQESIPALVNLLAHRHPPVRVHAAYALAAFGGDARAAAGELRVLLTDEDVEVRLAATRSLGATGDTSPATIAALDAALDDDAGAVTIAAAEALSVLGKPAVPHLIKRLKQPAFRSLAARVLTDIGPDAAAAVPHLITVLSTEDDAVRREAVHALASVGVASGGTESALMTILQSPDDAVRPEAIYALGRLGIERAAPAIETAIRDQDPAIRMAAAWALVALAPNDSGRTAKSLPVLTASLAHETAAIRREAAATLGRIGERARPAVPALIKATTDSDTGVRIAVMGALVATDPSQAATLKAVSAGLTDNDSHVRHAALYAAGRLGPIARKTEPVLLHNLASRESLERFHAAWALVRIRPDAAQNSENVMAELLAGLHFDDAGTRVEAARTLGLTRSSDPEVRTALQNATTDDEDESVQKAAEEALKLLRQPS